MNAVGFIVVRPECLRELRAPVEPAMCGLSGVAGCDWSWVPRLSVAVVDKRASEIDPRLLALPLDGCENAEILRDMRRSSSDESVLLDAALGVSGGQSQAVHPVGVGAVGRVLDGDIGVRRRERATPKWRLCGLSASCSTLVSRQRWSSHGTPRITAYPLAETSGDLTDLWYNDFDLRWKQAPMALAGMTTRGGLFVLETLAADHRMLVVYRGTHEASQDGGVRHVLSGPAPLIARATAHSTAPFWERLGRAMNECPPDGRRVTELTLTTSAEHMAGGEPLFSWLIAPRSPEAAAA